MLMPCFARIPETAAMIPGRSSHREAQVMRRAELGGHRHFLRRAGMPAVHASFGDGDQVGDHGHRGGMRRPRRGRRTPSLRRIRRSPSPGSGCPAPAPAATRAAPAPVAPRRTAAHPSTPRRRSAGSCSPGPGHRGNRPPPGWRWSGRRCRPAQTSQFSPTRARIASLARASKPSTSSVGSLSAKPSCCASRSASAKPPPPSSILLRM